MYPDNRFQIANKSKKSVLEQACSGFSGLVGVSCALQKKQKISLSFRLAATRLIENIQT
jgi:hypothetical protein